VIGRFSEDIDILIEPPADRQVATRKSQTSAAQVKSRKDFYDWLATTIKIDGISKVTRDTAYDNQDYFSGGIRLSYKGIYKLPPGLSEKVSSGNSSTFVTFAISKSRLSGVGRMPSASASRISLRASSRILGEESGFSAIFSLSKAILLDHFFFWKRKN